MAKVFDWDDESFCNILVQRFENIKDINWTTPESLTILFEVLNSPLLAEVC